MAADSEISFYWRLAMILLIVLGCFGVLALRLREIQVERSLDYVGEQRRQSVRRVVLPAERGRIFDRNGVCLADNKPSYCIAIYLEELRRPGRWANTIDAVDREIERVSELIGLPREITRNDIERHVFKRLPLPLLAWQGIDSTTLARFSESLEISPGFDIYVQPERIYPHGRSAAHVLGYVGRERPVLTNEVFHYNLMGMRGRAGIERSFDAHLAGTPGGELITVTVTGYKHSTTNRPAIAGGDVVLTLDLALQQHLEELLAGYRAAGVVMDVGNGDVLAMVSTPGFDPNSMSPSISQRNWALLQQDKGRPLLNRAISGSYPPGSIYKPLVALAALRNGWDASKLYDCTGAYTLGRMRLHCWARQGHGELDLQKAIEQSCNPFFCEMGMVTGIDKIYDISLEFGLGRRSGIEIGGEVNGLVPNDAWKRRVHKDAWRSGDTANVSIGQGPILVTPLQMAAYAMALANKGTLYRPRLVGGKAGEIVREIDVGDGIAVVRRGMYDVVQAPRGTGRRAGVPGLAIAGKTGTAEYGPSHRRRKHTWMIAFAPFEAPRVAMAVLVEDGESGGLTAAPIVNKLMRLIFREELPRDADGILEGEVAI